MENIAVFNSSNDNIDMFLKSMDKIDGVYITNSFDGDLDTLVKELRSSNFWYHPILTEFINENELLDEYANIDEAKDIFQRYTKFILKLNMDIDLFKKEEKLLLYLYLRDSFELIPIFNKNSLKLYNYPIVECLSQNNEDQNWLYELVNKDLLEFTTLKDRLRLCTKCNSAHLYFVDLCQQCKSINIKETKLLHCFRCGYVDDEINFYTKSGLECQKCHTELKLIGVDYDFPATQFKCQECAYISEDPLVEARCIDCGNLNDTDKLNVYEFYNLRISLFGREYLLSDQKKAIFSIFSKNLRYIKIDEFKMFLNWIISAYKRNKDFPFVLVLLEFSNMNEIIDFYGLSKMNELFHELSKRVLELLRDTDMLSVDDEHSIWILLPTTFKKGIEERLLKIIHSLKTDDGPEFRLKLKTFYSSEEDLGDKCKVDYIMDALKKED